MMQSTMQDFPLNVGMIFRHGRALHGESEVVTFEGDDSRHATFAEVADRVERLAVGLRGLGIERRRPRRHVHVEHPGAPRGVLRGPVQGAVLHTLNIRLFPEQLAYIVNHAGDRVIIVDDVLAPLLAPRRRPSSRRSSATSSSATATRRPLEDAARDSAEFVRYEDAARRRRSRRRSTSPRSTSGPRRRCVTRAAPPATRRVSSTRTVPRSCTPSASRPAPVVAVHVERPPPPDRADVPRQRVGRAVRGVDGRRRPAHARAATCRPSRWRSSSRSERPTTTCAVPTIWADLLRYSEDHEVDFSSLQRIMCGGAAVPRALMEAFQERFGIRMLQAWGMTETSPRRGGVAPAAGRAARHHGGDGLAGAHRAAAPGRRAAHRRRRRHRAAVGRRSGGGDPVPGLVDHRARTTAIPRPRSSTTAGCAPATSPASRPTAT